MLADIIDNGSFMELVSKNNKLHIRNNRNYESKKRCYFWDVYNK